MLDLWCAPPPRPPPLLAAHLRLGDVPAALSALDELWPGFRACCDAAAAAAGVHAETGGGGGAAAVAAKAGVLEVLAAAAPALAALPPPPVCFWDALAVCLRALRESGLSLAAAAVVQRVAAACPALADASAEVARPGSAADSAARVQSLLAEARLSEEDGGTAPPAALTAAAAAPESPIEPEQAASIVDALVTTLVAVASPLRAAAAAIVARRLFVASAGAPADAEAAPAAGADTPAADSLRRRWQDALKQRIDWLLPCALVRCGTEAGSGEAGLSVATAGIELLSARATQAAAELQQIDEASRIRWVVVPPAEGLGDEESDEGAPPAAAAAAAAAAPTRKRIKVKTDWTRFTPYTSPAVQLVRAAAAAARGGFCGPATEWLHLV